MTHATSHAKEMIVREGPADCPSGFRAAACTCGIKASGDSDLAIIVCDETAGATAAAMLTTNQLLAAPLQLTRAALEQTGGRTRALLINSGNANAATGDEGVRRAASCVARVAEVLKCSANDVLVNSTGVIGVPLPAENITSAIPELVDAATTDGLNDAAFAIRTTDTTTKMVTVTFNGTNGNITVTGIAKGSGMIHPNMATMIAVLMTDADVDASTLHTITHDAVDHSFHRMTVDGDTSTNDAVFALASGAAGTADPDRLAEAFRAVACSLARMIARDGEGARKLITVRVADAATEADALEVARTIAGSMLVRTAVTGGDPNWGRILAAACRSTVHVHPEHMQVIADGVLLYADGAPLECDATSLAPVFASPDVTIEVRLGDGASSAEFVTCDLTKGYIEINAEYTT